MQRSRLTVLVLGSSLLAACGTTVPLAGRTGITGANGLPVAPKDRASLSPSLRGLGPSQPLSSASGPGSLPSGMTPNASATPHSTSATTQDVLIPGSGPGVTDKTIELGLTWIDYRALVALGAASGHTSDVALTSMQEDAQAVVDAVNKEGGLAGRRIVPVYYEYPIADILNKNNAQNDEQAMCAQFTQDHHVFAIVTWISFEGVVNDCAAAHHTFVLSSTVADEAVDDTRFAKIGQWWYAPAEIMINRRDRAYVASIVRQHFIPSGAKVGLMTLDTPAVRASTESTLKPALRAAGINIATEIRYGTGDTTDSWTNYVITMRREGVTHVLWSYGYGNGNTDQFLSSANSQRYYPKYFLSSDLYPASIAGDAAPGQLTGSRAVGWSPVYDIGASWSDKVWNAGDKRCRKTQDDAGITNDTQATMYCDTLFFLQAALSKATSLTAQGLRQGAAALHDSYTFSSTTFGSAFPGARHDGVAFVRDMTYNPSTKLWDYASPNLAAPR